MRQSRSPEAAKLLPEKLDFHPESEVKGLIVSLFGGTVGMKLPSIEQIQEIAEAELSELRYQLFVAQHKLDLPGTQQVAMRSIAELSRLRGASNLATALALEAANTMMRKHLGRVVYPEPSNADRENARVLLNRLIEAVKLDVSAFESQLAESTDEGIADVVWDNQSFETKPYRASVSKYLYGYQLRVGCAVYVFDQQRAVVLEYFGSQQTIFNPSAGQLTRWLLRQQKTS